MSLVLRTLVVWITAAMLAVVTFLVVPKPQTNALHVDGISQASEECDVLEIDLTLFESEREDNEPDDDELEPDDAFFVSGSWNELVRGSSQISASRVRVPGSWSGRERGAPPTPPPEA